MPQAFSFLFKGLNKLATLHFKEFPYNRNLFSLDVREIEGEKFKGWQENASYSARVNVILQIDTTNVSQKEYAVAPNITFLSVNQAIVNIYQTWHKEEISFDEFKEKWAAYEMALEKYCYELVYKLNSARMAAGRQFIGEWYINYGLNEKHIEVREP